MSRQLIRNATIVNGDGITPPYLGDILIDGERIVHLGAIPHSETKTAEHVVDAAGMALALNLQADNSAVTQYSQNISTLQNRAAISGNALASLKTIADRAGEIATSALCASSQ